MPRYLNTLGRTKVSIAICGRCKEKKPYDELVEDGNIAGLFVCKDNGCRDPIDPWRLAPRETEDITLEHARPDLKLGTFGPVPATASYDLPANVKTVSPPRPWQPNTNYALGNQITPLNPVGFVAAGAEISTFTCVVPGVSGAQPPIWPSQPGVEVQDNTVLWLNTGLYLP